MEVVFAFGGSLINALTDWSSGVATVYPCLTVIIACALWIYCSKEQGFVRFLLPKEVGFNRSNLVDIKIFLFNILLRVGGFLTVVTVTTLAACSVFRNLSTWTQTDPAMTTPTFALMACVTLVIIFTNDFCTYLVHRVHHRAQALWPFRSAHHSAEVMTPLKVFRKRTVYDLMSNAFKSVLIGVAQGIMLFVLVGEISVMLIGSANAGYVIFSIFGANLRHIWLSFVPMPGQVFISRAQHQIHHSLERKHYNKNYGEAFAIWDRMFGSLYVAKSHENVQHGLSDENGARIAQPYATLCAALMVRFVDCWHTLWKARSRDPALKRNRVQQETAQ